MSETAFAVSFGIFYGLVMGMFACVKIYTCMNKPRVQPIQANEDPVKLHDVHILVAVAVETPCGGIQYGSTTVKMPTPSISV